jgi:hypothetical protein
MRPLCWNLLSRVPKAYQLPFLPKDYPTFGDQIYCQSFLRGIDLGMKNFP